ncbi:MAG TPA: glycine--tRNA ligase, partial [Verrucomicrobiae bacterium]
AMTRQRDDVAGLEATIIMSPQIWKASGHVDTFSDPMCDCLLTKKRFRADQIEMQSGIAYKYSGAVSREYLASVFNDVTATNRSYFSTVVGKLFNSFPQNDRSWIIRGFGREGQSEVEFLQYLFTDEASEKLKQIFAGEDSKVANFMFEGLLEGPLWDLIREKSTDAYSVLVAEEKNEESAKKIARKFYEQRGIKNPILRNAGNEKIENSQRFNPENGSLLTEPRPFNLMFKTYVGPVESEDGIAYLRPETAQAIFAQFKNVLETSRQRVPFGIAQVGKAFRNEVTPRNFTFRSREFEQMELEFFIKPDEVIEAIHGSVFTPTPNSQLPTTEPNWGWQAWHQYWVEERVRFYEGIGLSRATLGFHKQTPAELAHYARACTDILFKFPFSKKDADGNVAGDELEGIAARSDFDLSQHQRFSGKPMGVFDDELRAAWAKLPKEKQDDLWKRYYDNRKNYLTKSAKPDETPEQISKQATEDANGLARGQYIPHVIEPSAGVDRLILALIANAYSEVTETDEKGKSETRVTMKFHPRIAPFKAGIFPLLKNKPELVKKAQEVRELLRPWMNVYYDEGGSIGKRYARQDEAGTPFCVTIDFDTLGEKPELNLKDTVTIRRRDDGKQERIAISELLNWLLPKIR